MQLNKAYNKENFKDFLTDFLPDDFSLSEKELVIGDNCKNIKSGLVLGESKSLGVKVFYLEHEKEKDPRVALTTEAFKILSNNWAKKAMVVFNSKNSENWRLSLMTISFDINEKNKIVNNLSNPKRKSFFLGPNAKIATANHFLFNKGKVKDFEDLESRFDVEVVTKEFFNNYKKLYLKLLDYLKNDKAFDVFATKHGLELEIFGKKLLGQIVFIYFLQKKGWLGAKKEDNISNGDRTFLRNLFDKCKKDGENFFNDYLEHLFYDCLNRVPDRAGSFYRERFDCQIPFLNGGLFEPINDYKWQDEFINIPNEIFSNKENDGILDVFDLYNFTIDENTPDDQEISVDPEMLGKVFENLLESNTRKGQGAFYTPREIVRYMCQESLMNYLTTTSNLKRNVIEKIVKREDVLSEKELDKIEIDLDNMDELERVSDSNFFLSKGAAKEIDKLLEKINVVDPACGSGAFLVGMLYEIFSSRLFLHNRFFGDLGKTGYQLKKEAIQNSLYGVDIDPGAIDIAKLRLWLSIVVEEDINEIEPLPNLDYKIMQGNSLLENLVIGDKEIDFDFSGNTKFDGRTKEQKKLFENSGLQTKLFLEKSENLAEKLGKMHTEYFNVTDPEKKKILKKKIDSVEDELIQSKCHEEIDRADYFIKNNSNDSKKILKNTEKILAIKDVLRKWKIDHLRPFFPWKLHFGEVFDQENAGFDVVIANPPYINVEKLDETTKRHIFDNYKTCSGRTDIYIAFIEKSFQLLRDGGVIDYIIPYAVTNQKYGKELRELLVREYHIDEILDLSEYFIFDNAAVKNIVLQASKRKSESETVIKIAKSQNNFINNNFSVHKLNQDKFLDLKDSRLETKDITRLIEIKEKLFINTISLDSICFVAYGARLNHKNKKIKKEYYISSEKSEKYNKLFLEGKNIQRYYYTQYGWLDYEPGEHYNSMFPELFENEKIIFINVVSDRLRFALDNQKYYNSHTVVNCVKWNILKNVNYISIKRNLTENKIKNSANFDYKFLLAILNSNLMDWYFKNFLSEKMHFYPDDAKNIPIKNVQKKEQEMFIEVVDEILKETSRKGYNPKNIPVRQVELEKEIDRLVYKLYGLTEEEIKIVEGK